MNTSDITWERGRAEGWVRTAPDGIDRIHRPGRWDHGLTRAEQAAAGAVAHAVDGLTPEQLRRVRASARALRREWRAEERREARCEDRMLRELGRD